MYLNEGKMEQVFKNEKYQILYYVATNKVVIAGEKSYSYYLNEFDELIRLARFMKDEIKLSGREVIKIVNDITEKFVNSRK